MGVFKVKGGQIRRLILKVVVADGASCVYSAVKDF